MRVAAIERARQRHAERRRWVAGFCLPVGLFGLLVALGCFATARRLRSLQQRAQAAEASVVGRRLISGKGCPCPQVRYRFEVGDAVFSFKDLLRGRDSWVGLDPKGWARAQSAGSVSILYDRDDPWNNRPVDEPGLRGVTDTPWFFAVGGLPFLAVGGFCLLLGLAVL